jgi:hypothetical protein
MANNVLGTPLESCCKSPLTGFYRDGFCNTGSEDSGSHVICATVTDEFLQFSKSTGNDLITPMPLYQFPGLKAGDCWCLCALRWLDALEAGVAPTINLAATHEKALQYIDLPTLKANAALL